MVMRRNLTPRLRGYRGRRARRRGWSRWIVPGVFALAALPAAADYLNGWIKAEGDCRVTRVVDGDTLAMACQRNDATRLRLSGIDTPEIRGDCLSERWMALRASFFTRWQLLSARRVEIRADGGQDRYGRALGVVMVDGAGLEQRLLDAGLAVPYVPGDIGWCERLERET